MRNGRVLVRLVLKCRCLAKKRRLATWLRETAWKAGQTRMEVSMKDRRDGEAFLSITRRRRVTGSLLLNRSFVLAASQPPSGLACPDALGLTSILEETGRMEGALRQSPAVWRGKLKDPEKRNCAGKWRGRCKTIQQKLLLFEGYKEGICLGPK